MRQWFLRPFSLTHLAPSPDDGVELDRSGPSPTEVQMRTGSLVAVFSVIATGSSWMLIGAPDLTVNRVPPPPFLRLRHGDVLCAEPVSAMVTEPTAIVDLEASLVDSVGRAGVSETALAVAEDHLSARGLVGPFAGELDTLLGRGLSVQWKRGFAIEARLDLSAPMSRAWLRRWAYLLAAEPGFQFLRRLDVIEATDMAPHELELVAAELVGRLERHRLKNLELLELSAGFECVQGWLGQRLATVAATVGLSDFPSMVGDHQDGSTEPKDLVSFPPPPASSWQTETT